MGQYFVHQLQQLSLYLLLTITIIINLKSNYVFEREKDGRNGSDYLIHIYE